MSDARISVGLPTHPKTKKLIRRAGTDAAWRLVCLFLWAAQNKPDGVLSGMLAEDIELAVDWPGEDGAFVSALLSVGFLDGSDDEGYAIHDWVDHNPWAAGTNERSNKAKFNALCKHHGREEAARRMPEYAEKHGFSVQQACDEDAKIAKVAEENPESSMHVAEENPASSMHESKSSSAPSPSPSPSPSTNPPTVVASSPLSTSSAPEPRPTSTRKGLVCGLLRKVGMADAAPHYLTDDAWDSILAKRTDEEIVSVALAKMAARPGKRTGLKYIAPALLEDPEPITGNARDSPGRNRSGRQSRIDNYTAQAAAARGDSPHDDRATGSTIDGHAQRIA